MIHKTLLLIVALLLIGGCSSTGNITQLLDRLEFEEGQEGCVRAEGNLAVGGNPFATSRLQVSMRKTQGESPGEC